MKFAFLIFSAIFLNSCAAPSGDLPRFHEVDPGKVDRLAQPTEAGYRELAKAGIRTVVKLNTDRLEEERAWAVADGIRLIEKPLPGLGAPEQLEEDAIQALLVDQSLWPIAFHCLQGEDRTGLVAALYRVHVQGWTPAAAHAEWVQMGHTSLFTKGMDVYFWAHVPH